MKIGVYPGTFDPITLGHLDIIKRSVKIFDKVIVAITDNSKKKTLFNIKERLSLIKESIIGINNLEVDVFSGLLVKYASKTKSISIIRGLRVLSDFEYEYNMALMNRKLNKNIITLFLMPHQKYTHLSSSLVREVASLKGDVSDLVPTNVNKILIDKYHNE